ncbi:cyclic nucleotide-gated cation channel beta-1-like isoform X2 [Coccinella septempunctata]|uniref:cyclic nucleotide-gated cation channel beta-1-like isoform X2 n=1 Tax=Coccinella septempunctata TaxID=41139 RepID=UPI001D097062|nr:cyclic nucleotide-gated cation channel beta-1-like isoform X2 [Coccinella septempunctata]
MKLSVSAYRAHASAHKKILDTAYQLNYGSTSAFHPHTSNTGGPPPGIGAACSGFHIEPPENEPQGAEETSRRERTAPDADGSSDDGNTPLHSPRSQNTSREEDDSSNANESDKSPNKGSITKSNQRWMKLRTTVQISSAIQKKPPLKREDSFLQRFTTRQIPETQETVEDTGSEGNAGEHSAPRRRRRARRQPRSVVNPDENFYFYWLFVITICVLYNMWTLIVRQSFPELQSMISNFWVGCDSLSDIVFVLDWFVQLRTGYLEQGLMVYDSKKLACHYLRSRAFLLDIASLCPLDWLQWRYGAQPLLRFPRFFKVYRAVDYYYMVESRTVWPNLWRVINLIHILLILAHWFGCFYFLLSEAEGFQGDWVYPYRPGDYATLARKYLGSLYWSTLTLTTIGDLPTPETNAENTGSVDGPRSLPRRGVKSRLLQFNTNFGYIFTIVSYLIGVFIFATIVGQVGNVITNRNANRLEFERLLDGAKTYMRNHKVPGDMKRRVLRWYDYSWSRGRIQGGGDINTALGHLPDKLKTELALHVNLSVLKKVTIFQECQPEFLRDLVLKMRAYIFTPGDSICRKGEVAREMFIIADGILEVINEHGKVLTTMKAGDFFGEIGILNLDGFNKRTADVRSVGYSELFSLSREDVLAAMKDYPEAEEILQALGKKRLKEVKASARLTTHPKDHHGDPKGLVDKIKNEAKGLRNVLKKSRTSRRSQESLELQPLHTTGNGRSSLKRMSRVKSHDLSQDDDRDKRESSHGSTETTSPLGAGLPLLSRLRLLKEKQENEDRSKHSTSPMLSPSSSSIKSPPLISEEIPEEEPMDTSIPLLQRILLLKAKEERAAKNKEREERERLKREEDRARREEKGRRLSKMIGGSQPSSPTPTSPPKIETRASFSGVLSRVGSNNVNKGLKCTNRVNHSSKITLRERLKIYSSAKDATRVSLISDNRNSDQNVPISNGSIDSRQINVISDDTAPSKDENETNKHANEQSASDNVFEGCGEPHWSKLKKAAIGSTEPSTSSARTPAESVKEHPPPNFRKIKPRLILSGRNKQYRSIDDLSPEYGSLPFVKKLKILNERQKLEELETVIKTRSFSLDIPDNPQSIEAENLTRSHSEGCRMHDQDKHHLTAPIIAPSSLHSSTESNETPERRNLKSILKKLSEDVLQNNSDPRMPERLDSTEFRRLMRAPTIEGYAARHSKLSKSVTFNRDTLQSPPECATVQSAPQSPFLMVNSTVEEGGKQTEDETHEIEHPAKVLDDEKGLQLMPNKANQVRVIKALDDEQQYFADILLAIKQVMNAHLQEMQDKFHHRFERLEEEIKDKEKIINRLRAHIFELERNHEESFRDSVETIIGREPSWEDPTNEEREEIEELTHHPLSPRPAWTIRPRSSENVVLNIDSTTDTDSDIGDSSEQAGYESGEYENSSQNWEIELLAAQIRQRRSASLDTNIGRQSTRKRFVRGSSDDAYN